MFARLKERGLTASQLKGLAIFTMTLDHFYKVIVSYYRNDICSFFNISPLVCHYILVLLFGIGAMTMFIFAWFIAEGCRYTHNIKRYITRLLFFGLLAEIPFQWMIDVIVGADLKLHIGFTNIMFTFALGAMACWGYRWLKEEGYRYIPWLLPIVFSMIAFLLETDYGHFGVITVFVCYFVENPKKRLWALAGVIFIYAGIWQPIREIQASGFYLNALPYYVLHFLFALSSVLCLSFYRGERGTQSQYFFYLYYPMHMVFLVILHICLMPYTI